MKNPESLPTQSWGQEEGCNPWPGEFLAAKSALDTATGKTQPSREELPLVLKSKVLFRRQGLSPATPFEYVAVESHLPYFLFIFIVVFTLTFLSVSLTQSNT